MIAKTSLRTRHLFLSLLLGLSWLSDVCFAAKKEVETRPDGTTITRETTTFYPPETEVISHSIIIGIVVIFGGLIALFGVKLILRALELGHHEGTAEIAIDVSAKSLRMKKLAQGVVVTTIGAAIMLGALYFMTL